MQKGTGMNTHPTFNEQAAWIKWLALALAVIVSAIMVFELTGCSMTSNANQPTTTTSQQSTTNTNTTNRSTTPAASVNGNMPVPTSLTDAGEYGENIYDLAKANNWAKASAKLDALKKAAAQLRVEVKDAASDQKNLDASVTTLEKTVAAKDRQATMREANQVTLTTTNMTKSFKRDYPVEITLLDYYGRELELGAAANDTAKLKSVASDIRRAWNAVQPSIEARGGKAEAQKFGALVAQVEAAKTPADYARLATPVLDEVDNLEKVYAK